MEFPLATAVEILEIPAELRRPDQVEQLAQVTKDVKFFRELTRKEGSDFLHLECCKHMTSAELAAGQCVFKHNDPGDAFFIVLQGAVKILVPAKSDELPQFPGFKEVDELGPGSSFGDLALIHNKARSATAVCSKNSLFAVLSREVYCIISRAYERMLNERVDFLRQLPMFKQLTRASLQHICLSLEEESYFKDQVIYCEGTPADKTYFIRSGQVKLTAMLRPSVLTKGNFSKNQLSARKQSTLLQLCTKSGMDMFGYEEELHNQTLRNHSCVCASKRLDMYVVPSQVLLRKLQNGARAQLEMKSRVSMRWKCERLRSLQSVEDFKVQALQSETSREKPSKPVAHIRRRLSLSSVLSPGKPLKAEKQPKIGSLNTQLKAILPVLPRQMSIRSVSIQLQSRFLVKARSEAKLGMRWCWA